MEQKSATPTMGERVFDPVSQPEHYLSHPSGIEPIWITSHETFLRGNVIKYVMRAPYKGHELQDLKKAKFYLDEEIKRVETELLLVAPSKNPSPQS